MAGDEENLGATSIGRFQSLKQSRWRCVPEGRLESRPAIYRRYWYLEFDFVPEQLCCLENFLVMSFGVKG
jgi:hypothetical protein